MGRWIEAGPVESLAPGEFMVVDGGEVDLALFNVDGEFYCIDDLCTHDGGNLVEGDVEGCVVTCPRHGARFDVRTGEALSLPAVEATRTHAVRVRDGVLEVEVD